MHDWLPVPVTTSPFCSILSLYFYVQHFQFVSVVSVVQFGRDLICAFVLCGMSFSSSWAPANRGQNTTDCLNNHSIFTIRGKWISPIWALFCLVHRCSQFFPNHSWAQRRNSFQKFTFHMHTSSVLWLWPVGFSNIQYYDCNICSNMQKVIFQHQFYSIIITRTFYYPILG